MNENMSFSDKISMEILKSVSENHEKLITGGVLTCVSLLVFMTLLGFIFSKVKRPVSIKVPLIISLVTGIVFTAGILSSAVMPVFMKLGGWNEFMTAGLMISFFGFVAYSMVIASYFGTKALGKYSDKVSEKGIILGVRNMPDGSTAINPKWLFMNWKSLFTNALVLGAIGSGKTSAVLIKTVQQILLMKKTRPAAFVLDIKGDLYETVRMWNHPRQEDLVCYGYGYTPSNILGNEDILKTVNNLSKGFSYLDETGGRNSYYQDKQKNYLEFVITLLRLFCSRPLKRESSAYIYNKYIGYRSDDSPDIWGVFTIGTELSSRDFTGVPPLKNQVITISADKYDAELGSEPSFVNSDDFTISDVFALLNSIELSKAFYLFCKEYLDLMRSAPEFRHIYDKYRDYPKFYNALNNYHSFVFDKNFEMNISGLKFPLSTLSNESISRFFNSRGNTVDFVKDIEKGKIIFINVPEGDLGSEVARLVGIQFLFQYISALNRRNSVLSEVSKERPVFILIDEFFKFINREIMNFTSTSRSAKTVNILLGQSLGQFPEEYREALKSNLRTKIVFSIGDEVTAESVSRYLGEQVQKRRSSSRSYGPNGSTSQSESEQFDRKIKPHDLIELKPFNAAVSHFDGDMSQPAEIVSFPAWFIKGYNIFPVENFIFAYDRTLNRKAVEQLLKNISDKLGRMDIKLADLTVHKNLVYFALCYRNAIDENAVDSTLKQMETLGKYDLHRFSCGYDELMGKLRKLSLGDRPSSASGRV